MCPPDPKSASPYFSVARVAALCSQAFRGMSSLSSVLHLSPAVREAFLKHLSDHAIPFLFPSATLKGLHWLPLANQTTCKPLALVVKIISQNSPKMSFCYSPVLWWIVKRLFPPPCLLKPSLLRAMLCHLLFRGFIFSQVKFKFNSC